MASYPTTSEAMTAIQAHQLCASMVTTPTQYVVYYPATYKVPGGVAVKRGNDDLAALNRLYDLLDNFWNAQTLQVAKDA
jgi:hypothetical protein